MIGRSASDSAVFGYWRMSEPLRRVIRKPAGMDAKACAALRERLNHCANLHKHLTGNSQHILRLEGTWQEDESCLWIAHEPASTFAMGDLLANDAAGADAETLLALTAGVLDALQAAHGASSAVAHGAVCPGAILQTPDGQVKLADFGVVPALTAMLGAPDCLWLSVSGQGVEGADGSVVSAVWEVVPPAVPGRGDRICGFIDPEKYGTRLLAGFEPCGDIFAAGCLLYLLAHHRHPYFYDEPEALGCVEMAEYMAMRLPTSAFRKDLRESASPLVRRWSELVLAMVDRLPGNRLSAAQMLQELKQAGLGADVPRLAVVSPVAGPVSSVSLQPKRASEQVFQSRAREEAVGPDTAKPLPYGRGSETFREELVPPEATAPDHSEEALASVLARIRVASAFADRRVVMPKAALIVGAGRARRRLLLLGLPEVRMGRSRDGNDIVLRILPRSPVTDRLTRQISGKKPHLIISLRKEGLFIADQDTVNGTTMNGQSIKGEQRLPLDGPSRVSVGKTLELKVTPVLAIPAISSGTDDPYDTLGPTDELSRIAGEHNLLALLIQRTNNLPQEEQYLVLYRWADCSLAINNTVLVGASSSGEPTWRLHRRADQYWIENRCDGRGLLVDDAPIPQGEICPLSPGMQLRIGPQRMVFDEFQQLGL